MSPPEPPQKSKRAFFRAVRKVDDALYTLESKIITIFVSLMTLMVSADVIQRRAVDPSSKVGAYIARLFGVESPGLKGFLEGTGGTALSIAALAALVVFGFYSAERTREKQGEGFEKKRIVVGSLFALASTGGLTALIAAPSVESKYVFATVFLVGGAAVIVNTLRKKEERAALRAGIVALLMASAIYIALTEIPPGYTWSKKVSLLLLMWVAFIGTSMCARDGKHLRIEALARLVPDRFAPLAQALGAVLTMLISTFFAWLVGVEIFTPETGVRAMGDHIEMTQIPAWIRIFSATVGFSMITIRFFGVAVSAMTGGNYGRGVSELEEVLEAAEVTP